MRSNNIDINLCSTSDRQNAMDLLNGGGKTQVPCLRIDNPDGETQWMYESDDIINYLRSA